MTNITTKLSCSLQPRQPSTFSTLGLTRSKLAFAIGFGNSSMR